MPGPPRVFRAAAGSAMSGTGLWPGTGFSGNDWLSLREPGKHGANASFATSDALLGALYS